MNYSDRFVGLISGTYPPGNDPHKVAESIRSKGLVEEFELPFSPLLQTVDDYYQPAPPTDRLLKKGEEWKRKYNFLHEWVEQKDMKEALQYSPLGIGVYAWEEKNGVYVSNGQRANHWTMCYGWDDTKRAWKIFDSYDNAFKLYSYDNEIKFIKRYYVAERLAEIQTQLNWLQKLLALLTKAVNDFVNTPKIAPVTPITPEVDNKVVSEVKTPPVQPQEATEGLKWGNKDEVRHSIRVICDQEGMTPLQKDAICEVCKCESGFVLTAKRVNSPRSVDRGLFQWNNYWHPEITDAIAYDPEKATRLCCKAVKNGKIKTYWSASMRCWNRDNRFNSLIK